MLVNSNIVNIVQSDLTIPAQEVTELPEKVKDGTVVVKGGLTYIYYRGYWEAVNTPEYRLSKVKELVLAAEPCQLKTDLMDLLLDLSE